jgi:hypothetical protein
MIDYRLSPMPDPEATAKFPSERSEAPPEIGSRSAPPPQARRSRFTVIAPALLSLAIGAAVTFCVYGYQFGHGNHGVYLLDALRKVDPNLLRNDWFTTHTLQYHVAFTHMAALLMRLGLLQPGFAAVYLIMILMLHIAWRGIVHHLGGRDGAYLLSVAFYHLSAAGTALGMYQFLQDSSVLPSNIAGIAMLWGLWMWMIGRRGWAGACFGIAGIFHLNFAVVAIPMWIVLLLWPPGTVARVRSRHAILGTLLAIVPCALNILFALQSKLASSNAMPLSEFVNLYVRLRHPHHYNPASWPAGIWVAFMWTLIPSIVLLRGQILRIYQIFLGLIVLALLGAGLRYVSETLIQMSLYRFSIYLQLFGCIAAGVLTERALSVARKNAKPSKHEEVGCASAHHPPVEPAVPGGIPAQRPPIEAAVPGGIPAQRPPIEAAVPGGSLPDSRRGRRPLQDARCAEAHPTDPLRASFVSSCLRGSAFPGFALCAMLIILCAIRGPFFGFFTMPQDDPDYIRLCEWVSKNTPVDAVLLVPPDEESMRLIGRRAIVVNYKCVPQLSAELSEWAGRLCDVLDLRDLTALPHDYVKVFPAIRARYDQQPPQRLLEMATKYGARYIVTTYELPGHAAQRLNIDGTGRYMVYDLGG